MSFLSEQKLQAQPGQPEAQAPNMAMYFRLHPHLSIPLRSPAFGTKLLRSTFPAQLDSVAGTNLWKMYCAIWSCADFTRTVRRVSQNNLLFGLPGELPSEGCGTLPHA